MKAGKLDRRITFRSKTVVQNDFGEEEATWGDFDTVWAGYEARQGTEKDEADQLIAVTREVFQVRYRNDLNTEMILVYEGIEYDILSIFEIGRREGLEIFAEKKL